MIAMNEMRLLGYLFALILTISLASSARNRTSRIRVSANTNPSSTVDHLLHYYDRSNLPVKDRPVKVQLGVFITDIHSISTQSQSLVLSMYVRQVWRDPRLAFTAEDFNEIRLGDGKWNEFWVPDTVLPNAKGASFHAITVPNRYMALNSTGHVFYEFKLTVDLTCPMSLQKFPFDTQVCPISFKSNGYHIREVYYDWLPSAVSIDQNVNIPGFNLDSTLLYDCDGRNDKGAYSCAMVKLAFRRALGSLVVHVYAPSTALLILSWFTFWLPTNAILARIFLLFLPSLGMPGVWYTGGAMVSASVTAFDVWMMVYGLFLLATYMEIVLVSKLSSDAGNDDNSNDESKGDSFGDKMKMYLVKKEDNTLKIDRICRIIFPAAFLFFAIAYFLICSLA